MSFIIEKSPLPVDSTRTFESTDPEAFPADLDIADAKTLTASSGDDVGDPQQSEEVEILDELELALQKALCASRFEGIQCMRNKLLATTQLTVSNVISTVVTALPHRGVRRKRHKQQSSISAFGDNQETRESVYGAPKPASKSARMNKGPRGSGPHQAQLPTFRRSLPALAVPATRLHRELLLERDAFMAQLSREREEKAQLECWAATRIQACYRGFRSRPRVVAYTRRMKQLAMRDVSGIRLELAEMQDSLKKRGDLADEGSATTTDPSVLWRQGVRQRARRKRGFKNRQEERQNAAIRIQACVRKFLAKIAYRHRLARARDERFLLAIVQIQSAYRGYHLRAWIQRLVPRLKYNAAVQIQSLVRGSQARERVSMLRFERKCDERRRAGLPFQFSPGNRVSLFHQSTETRFSFESDDPTSSVRRLFEHRKSLAYLEFKSAKWHEQRSLLRISNLAGKLAARRARLKHRWNWTKTVVLDKRRQRRVKRMITTFATLSPTKTTIGAGRRLSTRLSTNSEVP